MVRPFVMFGLLTWVVLISQVHARGELSLKLPAGEAPKSLKGKMVFVKQVVDGRKFEDKPATANIPSLAAGLAKSTDKQKAHAVARARDGYGKARHNLFSAADQPVDVIARKTLEAALVNRGYKVVTDPNAVTADTIVLTVTINQFWGYIAIAGNAWTGSSMSMDGEMKLTVDARGRKIRDTSFEVSAKASHKFRLMTAGHWILMFEKLTADFLKNFPDDKL